MLDIGKKGGVGPVSLEGKSQKQFKFNFSDIVALQIKISEQCAGQMAE